MNQFDSPMALSLAKSGRSRNMGRVLLDMGKITPEDAERILRLQKESGLRFGEAAKELGLISDRDIQQVLASQFDYPYLMPGQGNFAPELVAAYHPFSPEVETLRAIRSQLMLRWFTNGQKSLVLASVNPNEGTSLFAANLAIVFSQLGEQTLLVDANMRTARQQEVFDLPNGPGLSDMLAGRADTTAVCKIDAFVDLSVLGAGTVPPNPQELVSRAAFSDLNQNLGRTFDVILYDVPAFASGSDALAVAARAGGVLLVIRKHKTRMADIREVSEQLSRFGAEVVGSVMLDF